MNHRSMASRILSVFILLAILLPAQPAVHAFAADIIPAESSTVPTIPLPGNGELFDIYLQNMFYPDSTASFFGESARNQLSPLGRSLYDFLNSQIRSVSSGAASSTVFHLSAEQISSWGGTTHYEKNSSQTAQEAAAAALSRFKQEFEVHNVISALLHDSPYELYWYDKVTGLTESGTFSLSGSSCVIQSVDFRFSVVADMQVEHYDPDNPAFDTSNVTAAAAAAANALLLVEKYADNTDYEKLLAYKDEICFLVSYDSSAASGDFSTDADPWQLIYVFDGDDSTNVVCEGYAKAFQYLYDQSVFQSNIECISVLGTMSQEGHMWNIVTINGLHYLTDITNSDSATVGDDGSLFLAGAAGDISSGYTVNGQIYRYSPDTVDLWGSDEDSKLNIAQENYHICALGHTVVTDPSVDATCTEDGLSEGTHCSACGEILVPQQVISASGHTVVMDPSVDATCTEDGLSEGTHCSACGEILVPQQVISAPGHSYSTAEVAPSCISEGYTLYACSACHEEYSDHIVPPLGHSWNEASCTAPKTCSICGTTDGTALDHKYVDGICSVCGRDENEPMKVPMYRLYNPYTQEHLLTSDPAERDLLTGAGWSLDGIAWNSPNEGTPVYRLYNPYDDWHTYSMNPEEIDAMVALGWKVDGVVCRSATQVTGKPVYRLFNPYELKNYHLLTASEEERTMLEAIGWRLDGAAWFCLAN